MIAAIVVLFHPNRDAFIRLLSSLVGQVSTVYAIDNTPGPPSTTRALLDDYEQSVTYIPLGENKGIGEAQNIGIDLSVKGGYTHVLLLDQDSVLKAGMVPRLLAAEVELISKTDHVAGVAPQVIDERSGTRPCGCIYRWFGYRLVYRDIHSSVPVPTDTLMASGSLIRTSVLRIIGTMRSDLFIEHVDTEWSLRALSAGYRCYCVPNAVLMHSIGDSAVKLFGKNIYLYSDSRYYYKLRNEVYLARLKTMGKNWRAYILPAILYHFVIYVAFSKNRLAVFRLLVKAIGDGIRGSLGPLSERPEAAPSANTL